MVLLTMDEIFNTYQQMYIHYSPMDSESQMENVFLFVLSFYLSQSSLCQNVICCIYYEGLLGKQF